MSTDENHPTPDPVTPEDARSVTEIERDALVSVLEDMVATTSQWAEHDPALRQARYMALGVLLALGRR